MQQTRHGIIQDILILITTGCFVMLSCSPAKKLSTSKKIAPFGISYAKATPGHLQPYNMVILEPDHYSKTEMQALKETGTLLIAYLSLGEVNKSRWYYSMLKNRGFLGTNMNWGSSYLNLADTLTRSIILEQVVPEIMIKDFDGLFLDTIDNVAPYTDRKHLQPYMVKLIKSLDAVYPHAYIIQNAGLFLLDQTKDFIDAALIEDVATSYYFATGKYKLLPENKYKERVETIRSHAKKSNKDFLIVDFGVGNRL